jgi:hypothetical protein
MRNATPEFIRDIFYSGQFGFSSDIEITNKIAFLINHNYLLFSPIHIASKSEYLDISSNQALLNVRSEASGGGNTHHALKLMAEKYLLREYGVKSLFEQPFAGYIPDVRSVDSHIICECGHTDNAEKIFTYFNHPDVRYVIQIPYPNDEDGEILGYEFQAQPNLHDFLKTETADKIQKIKDILNNR